jgi:hypothetical protein
MLLTIQPFLPAKDFSISEKFYLDLSFTKVYEDKNLILFKKDHVSFFIQNYYDKHIAENMVFQVYVDDLNEIHNLLISLKDKYPMIKVSSITTAHYGQTMTLHDPSGVLFHMTKPNKK